jgi:hypothetical protein
MRLNNRLPSRHDIYRPELFVIQMIHSEANHIDYYWHRQLPKNISLQEQCTTDSYVNLPVTLSALIRSDPDLRRYFKLLSSTGIDSASLCSLSWNF